MKAPKTHPASEKSTPQSSHRSADTQKSSAAKAAETRRTARLHFEKANLLNLHLQARGNTCVRPSTRPGYVRICRIDQTGACTNDCMDVPDKGGQILGFVVSG